MADIKHNFRSDELSFDNTEIAFRNKSDAELNKAFWLFKILSSTILTSLGPPVTLFTLKLGLPLQPFIKATLFKQFCGGETIEECEGVIRQLALGRVGTILDYSAEGEDTEETFGETAEEIIRTIRRAEGDPRIPLTVFKVTGIAGFDLLEKVTAKQELSAGEVTALGRAEARVNKICEAAFRAGVPVMIDAEESWVQDAIDTLALKMMYLYNREKLIVYNTYQLYRHDKLRSLQADISMAKKDGYILGAKLVRGAYMEKERKRAEEWGYPSPIHPAKEAADRDYNEAVKYCIEQIDHAGLVAGTHNEESCGLLVQLMENSGISKDHRHVYFSQLLGMSDNLSFNLAHAGYNVAKYVPYGPVNTVLPYLFRRARENTSIAGQTGRELGLIIREKRRRRKPEAGVPF